MDVETIMSSGPQLISEMPQALQEGSHSRTARAASRPRHRLCRCSMFPNSSRRAARPLLTRAVSTAANESGEAQSVGLGSGIGGIGAGAPAISAGMGQATVVGVLSVPTAWAGAAPSASPPVAMQFAGTAPYRLRRLVRTRAYRR
jgi:PPE-SVP subfamily C-terminal region